MPPHTTFAIRHTLHIGVDGNEANVAKRVGSNWYAYELLHALNQFDDSNYRTIYLKDPPLPDMPPETSHWHYRILRPRRFWTQWRLPLSLYSNPQRPQVFFSPGHYAPRYSPMPTVVTILDVAYLEYPNLFLPGERGYLQLKTWTEYSVKHAAKVIAISESTKRDLIKYFNLLESDVTVAYPGIDLNRFTPQPTPVTKPVLAAHGIRSPYILYVGTIQPRKNLNRLLEAFEQLPPKYKHYQLVIAGGAGWLTNEFTSQLKASKVRDRVRLTGYVPPRDLPSLYSAARCLVLIGLYEGFGIPPAEALACGTLPVVSDTSSLPEVIGAGGGVMVNPFSLTSIKHGIITALDLPDPERQERLRLGLAHIRQFTWEKAAGQVLKTLYDVTLHR